MNIKKISCSQFAGVRDRDITLTPGLNTIYGKNESGKSTLANMLSALFFQTGPGIYGCQLSQRWPEQSSDR